MRGKLAIILMCGLTAFAEPIPTLQLQPVYRLKPVGVKRSFITPEDFDFKKQRDQLDGIAFLAVTTNTWPAGLAPIFAVEKTNRIELRRLPAAGQENSSEPLFCALPPLDEPEAAKLAGRWECLGTRGTGTREFFGWDLAVDRENVAGRFDQSTDFRFARIAGGAFRSNRFDMRVEYIMDAYLVTGTWHDRKLKGEWRRVDESENGTWEATRPAVSLPSATNLVALYEWRRADGARQYLPKGESPGKDWERAARPLCRVWSKP